MSESERDAIKLSQRARHCTVQDLLIFALERIKITLELLCPVPFSLIFEGHVIQQLCASQTSEGRGEARNVVGHWKGGWSAVESQTQNEQQHNKNANSATTTPCLHALFICFADRCAACADFFSLVASLEESFCLPSPQDNKTQFGVNKPPRTGRQTHTHTHTRRHTHTHTATQKRECVSGYVCVRANTMHALCLHGLKFRLERPEFLGRCIHLLLQSSITRTHHCLGHAHAHAHTHARTHTHAHARAHQPGLLSPFTTKQRNQADNSHTSASPW